MSTFEDLCTQVSESRAQYKAFLQRQKEKRKKERSKFERVSERLVDAATTLEESILAHSLAPNFTQAKNKAYEKWVNFCTTIEQLRQVDNTCGKASGVYCWAKHKPHVIKWEQFSIVELEMADTQEKLIKAIERQPSCEIDAPDVYWLACQILEAHLSECCQDLHQLDRVKKEIGEDKFNRYSQKGEIFGKAYDSVRTKLHIKEFGDPPRWTHW